MQCKVLLLHQCFYHTVQCSLSISGIFYTFYCFMSLSLFPSVSFSWLSPFLSHFFPITWIFLFAFFPLPPWSFSVLFTASLYLQSLLSFSLCLLSLSFSSLVFLPDLLHFMYWILRCHNLNQCYKYVLYIILLHSGMYVLYLNLCIHVFSIFSVITWTAIIFLLEED